MIERLDYEALLKEKAAGSDMTNIICMLVIIVALYVMLQSMGILNLLVPSQLADAKMGYGMLFVIGLITSVHCIAMCGGINLSQCISQVAQGGQNDNRLAVIAFCIAGVLLSIPARGKTAEYIIKVASLAIVIDSYALWSFQGTLVQDSSAVNLRSRIFVPYGENVIEFTPESTGTVRYSCWMGMIRGNIFVTDGTGVDTK